MVLLGHLSALTHHLSRFEGIGKQAAEEVTEAFPPQIRLKFENVMCPLMLLHVNRYAGKTLYCL